MSPLLFNVFFAAPLEVIVTRFSKDEVIMRDLVYLNEEEGGGRTLLDRVRRAVWGMLYADDAGIVSKSADGLARMMTIIVEVFREFGLTVSERKTETLVMRVKEKQRPPPTPPPPLTIEAAGQSTSAKKPVAICCTRRSPRQRTSLTKDTRSLGGITPESVTPEIQSGSERAGTPNRLGTLPGPAELEEEEPAAETKPVIAASTPEEKMPAEEGVLAAKHEERVLVVGKGVVLTANVTSCDKVVVEGNFQGNIETGTFVLSEGGQMEGEVRCSEGCIGGNMKATIIASETLLIGKAAVVTGDMVYDSLQVLEGGRIQGKLTHYSSSTAGENGKEGSKPVQEAGG
ncbi:unnamed protein product [Ectocarpus sp. CCAP 1310/34]|nr:unnamed protein product [Ectocarpus sp. CCAP 1310/34]